MKTLLAIMTHGGAQQTYDRHMPYWKAHGQDIIAVCPTNDPVQTDLPILAMERSMHHGTEINRKFRRLVQFMVNMNYDQFVIHEYDSLCLQKQFPNMEPNKVWGNLFTSDQKEFQGHYFLHPPITMGMPVLKQLAEAFNGVPDETDFFWDRFLGYVCEFKNVPFAGYGERGFARNTIEPGHFPAAIEAKRKGAMFFHGVKSIEALHAITQA